MCASPSLSWGEPCPCLLTLRGGVWQFLLVKCLSVNLGVFLNLCESPEDYFTVVRRTVLYAKNEFKTNSTVTITFRSREEAPSP